MIGRKANNQSKCNYYWQGLLPVLVRILFSDLKDQAESVGAGQLAVTGFELQTEIRAHIKGFEMRINSGIYYIKSPYQDHKQHRVINIPPELVAVKAKDSSRVAAGWV
jgi:hypothetical protein